MAGLIWILLSAYLLGCTSQDQKNITAESGQDVILTCRAPNYTNQNFNWSRADLGDEYVLLYRDEVFVTDNQHPSFKNRVDLQDRQMKDGDVSLILKNVTINDAGTYECRVFMEETRSWKHSIIYLYVDPPGQKIAIRTQSGQKNVTLTCRAPTKNISVVQWSRTDLDTEYVLLYQDGHFIEHQQHPSFENRVDLQDSQMKDGDVSLILKHVMTDDTGTYKCHVFMRGTNRRKRTIHVDPISIVYLRVVDPPGETGGDTEDGSDGLKVGLYVPAVLVIVVFAVVGILIYRKWS